MPSWQLPGLIARTGSITTAPAAVPARNLKGLTMERNGCLYIAAITAAFWAGVVGLILLFT
jgi:hypothetical protein